MWYIIFYWLPVGNLLCTNSFGSLKFLYQDVSGGVGGAL